MNSSSDGVLGVGLHSKEIPDTNESSGPLRFTRDPRLVLASNVYLSNDQVHISISISWKSHLHLFYNCYDKYFTVCVCIFSLCFFAFQVMSFTQGITAKTLFITAGKKLQNTFCASRCAYSYSFLSALYMFAHAIILYLKQQRMGGLQAMNFKLTRIV